MALETRPRGRLWDLSNIALGVAIYAFAAADFRAATCFLAADAVLTIAAYRRLGHG